MYSPKIQEELIPYIYRIAKHTGKPMTYFVNTILAKAIDHYKQSGIFAEIEKEEKLLNDLTHHLRSLIFKRHKKTAEIIELLKRVA